MNDIAIIFNDNILYIHSVIMVLAIAATVLCAAGLRAVRLPGSLRSSFALAALAVPLGLIMSRLVYGIFALESFDRIPAMLFSASGGNSLPGAALGVLVAVLIAKQLGLTDNIPELLDCIAPAAALGICTGRLSAVFGNDDRGFDVPEAEASGYITVTADDGQHLLAVYAYESIFAAMLFVAVLLFFLLCTKDRSGTRSGDTALMFLLGFGGSQGVLESMRTDSLTVIGLGFVRVLQITALLCLVIPLVVFGVRAVKSCGMQKAHIAYWLAAAGSLALAVYMEFTLSADFQVQKHNYSVMASCLILVQAAALCLYVSSLKGAVSAAGTALPARSGYAPAPPRAVAAGSDAQEVSPRAKGRKSDRGAGFWD